MSRVVRAHAIVSGRVQGVFFRASTAEQARTIGVAGWVRNSGDDVEAVFEGNVLDVERMLEWCRRGPEHASVDHVETEWEEPQGLSRFSVIS